MLYVNIFSLSTHFFFQSLETINHVLTMPFSCNIAVSALHGKLTGGGKKHQSGWWMEYVAHLYTKHLRSFVSLKRIERGACTNALLSKLFPMTYSRMGRECNSLRENNNIQIALAKMFCYRASDTLRAAVANDIITIHVLFTWRSLLPNRWLVMNY